MVNISLAESDLVQTVIAPRSNMGGGVEGKPPPPPRRPPYQHFIQVCEKLGRVEHTHTVDLVPSGSSVWRHIATYPGQLQLYIIEDKSEKGCLFLATVSLSLTA